MTRTSSLSLLGPVGGTDAHLSRMFEKAKGAFGWTMNEAVTKVFLRKVFRSKEG